MTVDAEQQTARACADRMWAADHASRGMGMRLEHIAPGEAVLCMTVTANMTIAGGACNQGYVFSLADSAMAYASCTRGQTAVAQMVDITFDGEVPIGTTLTARALQRHRSGRRSIWDVRVETADGTVVAEFRGQTITLGATG